MRDYEVKDLAKIKNITEDEAKNIIEQTLIMDKLTDSNDFAQLRFDIAIGIEIMLRSEADNKLQQDLNKIKQDLDKIKE